MPCLAVFILLLGCIGSGCGGPSDPAQVPATINLLSLAAKQNLTQPSNAQLMIYAFARGGVERQTLTLQADSKIALPSIVIPARATLNFALAMPFNLGDGATARVFFRCKEGEFLLMERRLDPSRKQEDRSWYDASLSLDSYAGKQGQIVLQASADTGDSTGDWIGWGDLEIRVR